jgi:hypothetical protein
LIRQNAQIFIAVLALAGCATDTAAPAPLSADEAHRYCAGQMYATRVGHARGAPNWSVYDYCLKQHQAAGSPHARTDGLR